MAGKTGMMGLLGSEKSPMICLADSTQYTNMTGGQRDTAQRHMPRLLKVVRQKLIGDTCSFSGTTADISFLTLTLRNP